MRPILLSYFYFLYILKAPADLLLLLPFRDWAVGTDDSAFQLQHLFWDAMPRWTVKTGELPLTILWSFSTIPPRCLHLICSPRWIPFEFPFQLDALCYFTIALSRQLKKCKQFKALLSPYFLLKWWKSGRFLIFVQCFKYFVCLLLYLHTYICI